MVLKFFYIVSLFCWAFSGPLCLIHASDPEPHMRYYFGFAVSTVFCAVMAHLDWKYGRCTR